MAARAACFFAGHKKPVGMLVERKDAYYTKGCPRCGIAMGLPVMWKSGAGFGECSKIRKGVVIKRP